MTSNTMQSIDRLREAMSDAVKAEDWHQLAAYDVDCRNLVGRLVRAERNNDEMVRTLKAKLMSLLEFYHSLLDTCNNHRNVAAGELVSFRRMRHGSRQYSDFQKLAVY